MSQKIKEIKTISADSFKDKEGNYIFPFEVIDKRTDGSSLGRIMFQVELVKGKKTRGRYYIEKILLWVGQTRDERYAGKIFEIPCYSESLLGDSIKRESFLNYVWQVGFCEVHKNLYFSAYPANYHTALKINVDSSIGIDMDFI